MKGQLLKRPNKRPGSAGVLRSSDVTALADAAAAVRKRPQSASLFGRGAASATKVIAVRDLEPTVTRTGVSNAGVVNAKSSLLVGAAPMPTSTTARPSRPASAPIRHGSSRLAAAPSWHFGADHTSLVAGLKASAPPDLQVSARRFKQAARQSEIRSKQTEALQERRAAVREVRTAGLAVGPPPPPASERPPSARPPPRRVGGGGSGSQSAPTTSRGARITLLHMEGIHIQPRPVKPPGEPVQPHPVRATVRRQHLHEQQQWQAMQQQRQRQQLLHAEREQHEQQERQRLEAAFEAKLERAIQQQQLQLQQLQQLQGQKPPMQQQMQQGQVQGQLRPQHAGGEPVGTNVQLGSSGSQSELLRISARDVAAAVEEAFRTVAPGSLAANKRALEARLAQLRQERQQSPAFALYATVKGSSSGGKLRMRAPPALPAGGHTGTGADSTRRMPPAPPAGHLASKLITNPQPVVPGLTFRSFAICGEPGEEPEDRYEGAVPDPAFPSPTGTYGGAGTYGRAPSMESLYAGAMPPVGSPAASRSPSRSPSRLQSRPSSASRHPGEANPRSPLSRPSSASTERTAVKLHVTALQVPVQPGLIVQLPERSLGHSAGLEADPGASSPARSSCTARLPAEIAIPSPRAVAAARLAAVHTSMGVLPPPSSPIPGSESTRSAFAQKFGARSQATQPPHA